MAVKYVMTNLPIKSMAEANQLTLGLYKTIQKNVPNLIAMYDVSFTPEEVRARVREMFKRNQDVTDFRVSQLLLVRGAMLYDEMVERYAPVDHFANYMKPLEEDLGYKKTGDKEQDMLQRFYLGIEDTERMFH